MELINSDEIWKRVKEYDKSLSDIENKLILECFNIYCKGNDVEFESSPHKENEFQLFKISWIMSSIWK